MKPNSNPTRTLRLQTNGTGHHRPAQSLTHDQENVFNYAGLPGGAGCPCGDLSSLGSA